MVYLFNVTFDRMESLVNLYQLLRLLHKFFKVRALTYGFGTFLTYSSTANVPILYSLKTLECPWFSGVFTGYKV